MKKNIFALLIFITTIFSFVSCSKNPSEKGYEFLTDMVYSPALEAYSENKLMKDGKTMQLPPAHSIARGKLPFPYQKGVEEAIRAGEDLDYPFELTEKTREKGRVIFSQYCQVCHGARGKGDGPLIPKFPNPPSFTSRRLRKYKPGRIFHIVTRGSGDMPSHESQISYKDRWYLVQYVKYMQKAFRK